MGKSSEPFGEQAARFSLYTPLVVFLIGAAAFGNRDQHGVAMALASINIALILIGFVLAIVALSSMRRYGKQRILVRAVLGLIANGLLVAAMVPFMFSFVLSGHVKSQVVGHWHMRTDPGRMQYDLSLDKNDTFHVASNVGTIAIGFDGHWELARNRVILITIDKVNGGDPAKIGKRIGLGTVKTVNDKELILGTDKGEERYDRIP